MRQYHVAAEKTFVDYSGKRISIVDPKTRATHEAEIFVGVLGASNLTYAEATWTQQLPDWTGAHARPEQGFRTCLGLLRSYRGLDASRVEAVSARALELGVLNGKGVASLLARKPDDAAGKNDTPAPLFDSMPDCTAASTSIEQSCRPDEPAMIHRDDEFVIQDRSGGAFVETGPRGEGSPLVANSETVTVQGRFEHGFIHGAAISDADGHNDVLGPPGPPPPGAPRRGKSLSGAVSRRASSGAGCRSLQEGFRGSRRHGLVDRRDDGKGAAWYSLHGAAPFDDRPLSLVITYVEFNTSPVAAGLPPL